MRILILDFDLFASVGGGQSAYHRLIALHPENTFYYLRREEAEDAPRPANAVAIPFVEACRMGGVPLPRTTQHLFAIYVQCRNIAASIRRSLGCVDFDVVDAPDYSQLSLFIRPTLQAEGIRTGTVLLALHGTLSMALQAGWPTGQDGAQFFAELRVRERLQFRAVDARYAISPSYAERWRRYAGLHVHVLDPLNFIDAVRPTQPAASAEPPDLVFVGRREKWKGPDLFLDFAWCLDRSSYRRLLLVGPDGPNRVGRGSDGTMAGMARSRGLQPELLGSQPRSAIRALFDARTLLLLPSRHDTFNLTALEALARGCPAIVSDQTGFAAWLRSRMPELEWLVADIGCSRSAAVLTGAILRDYDACRARLAETLSRHRLEPDLDSLEAIYRPDQTCDLEARQTVLDLAAHFALQTEIEGPSRLRGLTAAALLPATEIARAARQHLPSGLLRRMVAADGFADVMRQGGLRWRTKERLKGAIRRIVGASPRAFAQINQARGAEALRAYIVQGAERRPQDVANKIARLSGQIPERLPDRVRLFRELVRLERRAGHELVAATYAVRIMRWLGRDAYGDLPFVRSTLRAHGFPREAEVATAMFGDGPDGFDRCLDAMRAAYADNRTKPDLPLAVLDDRRGTMVPRVAVIVSLYNAAGKLPTLLTMLQQQSLAQRGELEVVLVDSDSPADEQGAFAAFAAQHSLPMVYARSHQRETIQAAWNRGIKLSRAPYLSFLGADEGLHPDALRQLAEVLDGDAGIDWAMADSVVTSVDARGVFDADIMTYDRSGYRQDLVYLETCYLSWVGGLYRRSIHDRFGWYDESFRAAGDTEFKCRVMPHIRSAHVPRLLGVFNNYPEERTTQHPRAELEDLRAWYLWRTVAGMHYAFAQRPADEAVRLLQASLNYRKSFCGHLSTDFDLADAIAEYLASRPDAPDWVRRARPQTAAALALVRNIDLFPATVPNGPRGIARAHWLYGQLRTARRMAAQHGDTFGLAATPHYEIFNDNRYEQHWYSWSAT